MERPLLRTKLYVPQPHPDLVARPRLIERLDEGLRRGSRLTLISAPAGFGKTTLVSEWVHGVGGSGRPDTPLVGWVSLDEGDNDPARFWAYFVAALRTTPYLGGTGVGTSTLAPFSEGQSHLSQSDLTELINHIAAGTQGDAPGHFYLLVLDDYHLISADPIHDAVGFLLNHLPGNMHLIIATRADPPLPVARLRGRGQLTELRFTDLRFTADETTEFLNQAMRLDIEAGDVAVLSTRTEGWIAGLQIVAASLQGRDDVTGFIHAFAGSDRYILDYLVQEVLGRQPDHIQAFLLQTSILERLCASVCDAILDEGPVIEADRPVQGETRSSRAAVPRHSSSCQEILEYLETANLFVVPLDERREWYRYHRLFADLLRQRLGQEQPGRAPTLHRRASRWYERRAASLGDDGLLAEAIHHALAGEDFEGAAQLIETVAEATLMRGEVTTFLGWVAALPERLLRARPSLAVYHAWAMFVSGERLETVQSRLGDVDEEADLISGKAIPLRAFIAALQGRMADATRLSRQALEELPEDNGFLRAIATWLLGICYRAEGDVVAGIRATDEAVSISRGAGNVLVAVLVLCHSAELRIKQGQLHQAEAIYRQALELAVDHQGHRLPFAGQALIGLGELWREWNDIETATRYLSEGIQLTRVWRESGAIDGYLSLARIKQAQGDVSGAQSEIQSARQLAVEFDVTQMDDLLVAIEQARLWVAQGNLEAAAGWARERSLEENLNPGITLEGEAFVHRRVRKYEQLVLARLLIAQGRPDRALAVLEPLLPGMESWGRTGTVIEIEMLKALALQAQGEVVRALTSLSRALALAEPEGYVRLFVDEGPPMAQLLANLLSPAREKAHQVSARGFSRAYVGVLLAAFDKPAYRPQPLVEPLSQRELEVLQLIAAGLSNREIAQQLFLSLATVKWHTSHIYAKLGVKSRTQAVTKARGLGILPTT